MAAQGNLSSNIYTAGNAAKVGVYPTSVIGTITFSANNTLTSGELYTLCKIPANSYLNDFVIQVPDLDGGVSALTLSLQDNAGTPVVYVIDSTKGQSGGVISMSVDIAPAVIGTQYSSEAVLNLKCTTTAGGTIGGSAKLIYFRVSFAPL